MQSRHHKKYRGKGSTLRLMNVVVAEVSKIKRRHSCNLRCNDGKANIAPFEYSLEVVAIVFVSMRINQVLSSIKKVVFPIAPILFT